MKKEPYYTVAEVADYLKIERKLVRAEIRRGRLGANYIGGEYRISPADLEKYEKETHTGKSGNGKTEESLTGVR